MTDKIYKLKNELQQLLPSSWQERVKAVNSLHNLYLESDPNWTNAKTASNLGISEAAVARSRRLASYMHNPKVSASKTQAGAMRIIQNNKDKVLSSIETELGGLFSDEEIAAIPHTFPDVEVIDSDFETWAEDYDGEPFDVVHMDAEFKEDVKTLIRYREKLLGISASIVTWTNVYNIENTIKTLTMMPDMCFFCQPFVWVYPNRRGCNYMTAIFGGCGVRVNLAPEKFTYNCHYQSNVDFPEPMLRYLLRPFINKGSSFLETSSRTGASLFAAHDLGAKHVVGIAPGESYFAVKNTLRAREIRERMTQDLT